MYVCLQHWSYNQAELWPSESHSPLYIPRNYTLEHNMNPCDPCTSLYSQYFKTCWKKTHNKMNKTDCLWAQGHRRKSLYHHASVMSNQANPSFFNFTWRFGVWWPHTSWHIGTARFLHKGWTQSPKPFAWPCCHKDELNSLAVPQGAQSWQAQHRPVRPSSVGSSAPVRNLLSWQRKGSRPTGFLGTGRHRKPWKTRPC